MAPGSGRVDQARSGGLTNPTIPGREDRRWLLLLQVERDQLGEVLAPSE